MLCFIHVFDYIILCFFAIFRIDHYHVYVDDYLNIEEGNPNCTPKIEHNLANQEHQYSTYT